MDLSLSVLENRISSLLTKSLYVTILVSFSYKYTYERDDIMKRNIYIKYFNPQTKYKPDQKGIHCSQLTATLTWN